MIKEELYAFLCQETTFEELGNQNILHEFPIFGNCVGEAINSGKLLDFSKELSLRLGEMDLYKACILSNFIGFACEKENDTSAGQGIVTLFSKACNHVYEMFQSTIEDEECQLPEDFAKVYQTNPDWARAYYGFETICISVMAFLTRDVELRKLFRKQALSEKVAYLAEETPQSPYLHSVYYVNCMQKTCSGLKLLVLQPGKEQGFLAEANDLYNCFHLLFLLEEQIAKNLGQKYGMPAFPADEALVRLAHGEYPENCGEKSYVTYFMECNYTTVSHTKFHNEDAYSLIWGEMPPEAIPEIDGYAVIVLQERGITRSFDANFLAVPHNALRPSVRIDRELTKKEYDQWLERIKKALSVISLSRP